MSVGVGGVRISSVAGALPVTRAEEAFASGGGPYTHMYIYIYIYTYMII